MKLKVLLATALLGVVSLAQAEDSVSISYATLKNTENKEFHMPGLAVRKTLNDTFTADYTTTQQQADASHAITNRNEFGLTGSAKVASFATASVRGATGWRSKNTGETTRYTSIEPSVSLRPQGSPVAVKLGYRYRNGAEDSYLDNSRTARVQLSYDVTKTDRVYIGRDKTHGDTNNTQLAVGYTRLF